MYLILSYFIKLTIIEKTLQVENPHENQPYPILYLLNKIKKQTLQADDPQESQPYRIDRLHFHTQKKPIITKPSS